jgi:centromeric protein E
MRTDAATIFAYGQTSSGKTYTMRGVTESAIADIYDYIQKVLHHETSYILQTISLKYCALNSEHWKKV